MNHSVSFTSQDSDQGPVPRPGYCDNGNVWGGPGNSGNSRPASTRHQPPPGTHNGLCIWTLITSHYPQPQQPHRISQYHNHTFIGGYIRATMQ